MEYPEHGVTPAGLRTNIDVGVRYIVSWLSGVGAAAIHDLMEDAATAEISRAQVWQWVRHGITLSVGDKTITERLVRELLDVTEAVLIDEGGESGTGAPGPRRLRRGGPGRGVRVVLDPAGLRAFID